MRPTMQLYQKFEQLVGELYAAEGYILLERKGLAVDVGFDFLLRSPQGERVAIEVKLLRTAVISRGRAMEMLRQAVGAKAVANVDRMILVISGTLGIPFSDTFGVELIDLPKIIEMATRHPAILLSLEELLREVSPPLSPEDRLAAHIFGDVVVGKLGDAPNLILVSPEENAKGLVIRPGDELIANIRAVPGGKPGARQFEITVLKALRYVFGDDLSGWSEQKVTRNGLSRYDVIARISSDHDVWRSIVAFFRSWYVVFEFKNYSNPVTQKEITSTEKYLYGGAMRMVAFVVSRRGASENALEMARGALREQGKLIINLSVDDVFEMVRMKDRSNDPNGFLYDILDGMLMRLER